EMSYTTVTGTAKKVKNGIMDTTTAIAHVSARALGTWAGAAKEKCHKERGCAGMKKFS
ncbi:hypothetical protein MTO96_030717, partial [Rhipicephalus appendiculatus]